MKQAIKVCPPRAGCRWPYPKCEVHTFRKDRLGEAPITSIVSAATPLLGPGSGACNKQGLEEARATRPCSLAVALLLDDAPPLGCQGWVCPSWLSEVTGAAAVCGVRSCSRRLRSRLQADRLEERPASDMTRGLADPDCLTRIECSSETTS